MSTLTIESAAYANREHTAATIVTAQRGAVAIGTASRPELWQQMLTWAQQPGKSITPYPLEEIKADRRREVEARFDAALEAGMAYGGKVLQIRPVDQANITVMGQEARWAKATGAPWPAEFAWRMADNTFFSVPTADDMIELGEAAKAEVYRLRLVKWGHDDAIGALTTAQAIAAYDINSGW